MDPFAKWKNANGTYNGAACFAEVTGIPQEEILWTFNRMKQLKAEGRSKEEMKRIAAEEAKSKPWLSQ